MDIIVSIILLGIVQALFIGFVFINKNKKANSTKILGFFFVIIAFSISNFLLRGLGVYKSYPFLKHIILSVLFLIGPVFYFYLKSLTVENFSFTLKSFLHFTPFMFIALFNLLFYIVLVGNIPFFPRIDTKHYPIKLFSLLQLIQIFIYLYFIRKNINTQAELARISLSDTRKVSFRIINLMVSALILIFGMGFVFYFIWVLGIDINDADNIIIPFAVTIVIFVVGYIGLKQPELLYIEQEIQKLKKYEKSTLTKERSEEALKQLLLLMETEKPYLDNELTLIKLSERISLSPHHLSQIINENTNQNFFDFINSYRIEEAKKMFFLPEYSNYTIIAIAMESGFNSKSAFNIAFKKFTNQTPTSFRAGNLA